MVTARPRSALDFRSIRLFPAREVGPAAADRGIVFPGTTEEGGPMEWQDRFNAALDYIEDNLDEKIEWRAAAAEANCSTFHFLRMFEVIAGVSPGEYVRRRRLSLAALKLASGETKVIDAALAAGYDSPDAFGRAFRREFGLSPSEARAPGTVLKTWPRLVFSVFLKGDSPMNFRIEQHEAMSFTGLALRTRQTNGINTKEIPAFWQKANADGTVEKIYDARPARSKMGRMGVCVDDYNDKTQEFTYLIAIETPADKSRLPKGCVDIKAPAGTWAIFPCRGPLPGAIQEVWRRIFHEWFPTSGYEHGPGPELEVYSEGDSQSPDYYSEVWIPVRKSSGK
jgi:AraC family transcriptional regulator